MKIEAAGLRTFWWKREGSDPKRCIDEAISRQEAAPLITLAHLSGAFLVLAAGYVLSVFSFLFSLLYQRLQNKCMASKELCHTNKLLRVLSIGNAHN